MGPNEQAIAAQMAGAFSKQKVDRNSKGAQDGAQLLPETPLRSGLEITNQSANNRLYIGWGSEEIEGDNWSFPIEPEGTYQDGRGFWRIPKVPVRYKFENGSGSLVVTHFRLDLPSKARRLVLQIRRGNLETALNQR